MSDLDVSITGFVEGDDLEIRRTITGLEAAIETAWLTVKREPMQEDDAVLEKEITTDNVTGIGQSETAGGPGESGVLRFELTDEDTRALGESKWIHDIQIALVGGKIYTVEIGTIQLTGDVRITTS